MQILAPPGQKLQEKCGIVGVFSKTGKPATQAAYTALRQLQHRGQDGAGISAWNNGRIATEKGFGLIVDAFRGKDAFLALESQIAIGHTRYRTNGELALCDLQPFSSGEIAIAHNGQVTNSDDMKLRFQIAGRKFQSSVDSETILQYILTFLSFGLQGAISGAAYQLKGAYSVAGIGEGRLFAFRDSHGLRPLVLGENNDFVCVASETVSLKALRMDYSGDINAGELMLADSGGIYRVQLDPPTPAHCMFEFVYFSRPDSRLDGKIVGKVRKELGRLLASESGIPDADVVIFIPETSRISALEYSNKSKIPIAPAILKKDFLRTFILPSQAIREGAAREKYTFNESEIRGRRIILVDDSIIRATTIRVVIKSLRELGAREIHVRIPCPPIISHCPYGINISEGDYLAARGRSWGEIASEIGADSVAYLSLPSLEKAIGLPICKGCLTGTYPE